jgi:predicted ABC-type ATPase
LPKVVLLAGPNGAGKTTSAKSLLRDSFAVDEFVNADPIAQALSPFKPEAAATEAGRIMLRQIRRLFSRRSDFAFETTLASRSPATWLRRAMEAGYESRLIYLSLPSAEISLSRVSSRVRLGGHHVPDADVRRRHKAGLDNLFRLYMPIVSTWHLYDNSRADTPVKIAEGGLKTPLRLYDENQYSLLLEMSGRDKQETF